MMERFKQWFAEVPFISLVLMKLCPVGDPKHSSVVRAEWRWKRCSLTDCGTLLVQREGDSPSR